MCILDIIYICIYNIYIYIIYDNIYIIYIYLYIKYIYIYIYIYIYVYICKIDQSTGYLKVLDEDISQDKI